ncbi:MAG: GlsB/YeaQ/YmgE family stress response membrane protein [Bacteroidales bacterium]|nr:GlsB/YeaQ/YmgE family stress response membrane protein [Bacteroidales bacterium]MBR7036273.1 GlsB/YeaQ/YmgE family stress response membrane protein [Bacteroidales bacterium]
MVLGLLLSLAIGALAGFLGSKIFSGAGKGLLLNLLIGIVGGFIGGWLFGGGGLLWQLISATVGAIALLWIISLIKK